jgi:ATP-dependent helicase/nuclease subunit A
MTQTAAYEHNGLSVSAAAFYAVACDPQRSVAVEACAGAGKTWMLVARIVRALLEGAAPHNILAITFTKKAAAEMRQRLQKLLAEFAVLDDAKLAQELQLRGVSGAPSTEVLATLRGLNAKLLAGGRPVQIRTFHSWFAALLRSAPLGVLHALNLPTQYELLENDALAVAQVWRVFLTRVAQDPDALADYREAVACFGRHQTHKALQAALDKRTEFALADAQGVVDASVQHFTLQFPAFAGLTDPFEHLQQASVVSLFWEAAKALGACSGKTCQTAASALEAALTAADWDAAQGALMTKAGTPRKLTDKQGDLTSVQVAQALLLDVVQARHQHAAWQHQQRMARLTRGLCADYAALKRTRGWLDMGDLERTALVLLSDSALSGWVQERLDARVSHVLIDEFQDTNPLQWQALHSWLSSYTGAGKAPSVFIVGDPKQSIYRFRRAEPQVFRAAKQFVVDGLQGDVLSCDHTRRNAPEVLAVVNTAMLQAQGEGLYQDYRAHTTAAAHHGEVLKLPRLERAGPDEADADDGSEPEWRNSLTTPRVELEETRKTLECRQAALWLAQQLRDGAMQTDGLRPEQVMVLARKRERLGLVEQELAALGVPVQQPEKNELNEFAEVQDVIALLDVLVSPRHDLSLAQVLKSPIFGASDDDLVSLVQEHRALRASAPTQAWYDTLQAALLAPPMAWPQVLLQAAGALARWQTWLQRLPPHDALSAIFEDGDLLARYAAASPPAQRERVLGHVRAVLHAALQVDGGRFLTAYGLVRALRAPGLVAPVRAQEGAVRLLTIHGAKGLEARLVLVLDTDGEAAKTDTMGVLVDWPGEARYPQRFVFLASESNPPACAAELLAREMTERSREELNALYVALTRTEQTLVISSLAPHRQAAGSWWNRLQALATAVDAPDAEDPPALAESAASISSGEVSGFTLKYVQKLPLALMDIARAAPDLVAIQTLPDSLESRMGQAMHRLLEWVPLMSGGWAQAGFTWSAEALLAVARDFSLLPEQAQAAADQAQAILRGEGHWAWDADALDWHANEVPMLVGGRTLRLDRLVRQRDSGQWWVLDYKSTAQPERQPELCAQLLAYQGAVARSQPMARVRAAFLTPQGALIELPA